MLIDYLILVILFSLINKSQQFDTQQFINQFYLNKTTTDLKYQLINEQILKCSDPALKSECNVCSLCENDAVCRPLQTTKSKLKFNNDPLTHLREIVDFICYCVPGFTGDFCQTNVNECLTNPCSNNATCIDGINSFECKCPPGFRGRFCEININECESSPCKFSSKCIDLINEYKCECLSGYTGPTCSIDIDECEHQPCQNNATCLNLINQFKCDCNNTGFEGDLCQHNINDCLNVICQHNSTCIDGINSFECKCQPGFTGSYCEIDINECESSPCQYGKCWENSNPESFIRRVERLTPQTGSRQIALPILTFNQSESNSLLDLSLEYKFTYSKADGYFCECTPGYTGLNCETKINECESSPCGSNGECIDLVNAFKCNCLPGFTGTTCQENINECILYEPCAPMTQCIDLKPDYSKSKISNGYYCDCSELNMNLIKLNKNKHVQYTGQNCTTKLNLCETQMNMCKYDSECESIEQDIKCTCKSGYTGKYCQDLTTLCLNGTFSPMIHLNSNDTFHLAFKFKLNLNEHKQTLLAIDNSIEINLFKNYLKLNQFKLGFYDSNTTWHSIELIKNSTALKLVYSVDELNLIETKAIKISKPSSQIQFGVGNMSPLCLRDVYLNDEIIFKSSNNPENYEYGFNLIKNECGLQTDYCKHGSQCVYKWFINECLNCPEPFYGEQCHLVKTKLGFLNKSPNSPLSSYMTLNLLSKSQGDTFQISFQITRLTDSDLDMYQLLFLTLKQLNQNNLFDYFYALSIDEKGYLNLKKIQLGLNDSAKVLKWSLSNEKLNLSEIYSFNISVKMSQYFIELKINNKHITRYELVNDSTQVKFEIEQVKFSNNFIINNSVSFLVSNLEINQQRYEFTSNDLNINIKNLDSKEIKIEISESLNLNLFNITKQDADIADSLNSNEQFCPNKNCYRLKENKEQELVIKNLTCNQDFKQCQRYSSIRRYLFKESTHAELTYLFDFHQKILDENFFNKSQSTLDINALNKRRISLLRAVDFHSISFDLNLNYLNLKLNEQQQQFNLFVLNSFDDSFNSKFLFGLNLITLNTKSLVKFELFTSRRSIQSDPIEISDTINLNTTFTFSSIGLYVNKSESIRLSNKNVNLFYASQLKTFSSFQLGLISNLNNTIGFDSISTTDLSVCMFNFELTTHKSDSNQFRKYFLIDQTKSINLVDDLKLNDLNEQCSSNQIQFDEHESRGLFKTDCYLVSKFNVATNEKNDYYTCKCNQTNECSYHFWSKLGDQTSINPSSNNLNNNTDLEVVNACDFACFNNGTCIDNILNQTDSYLCICPKYFTGKRCELFDACLNNQCSINSKCKPRVAKFEVSKLNLYECDCNSGYLGDLCTIRIEETCLINPCQNGGVCSNVTQLDEPNKLTYECSCPLGYEGKNCQDRVDFCALYDPCSNGATCTNLYNSQMYKCSCLKGWKGVNCTQDIDECEVMRSKFQIPCSSNGQCINKRGDYNCVCNQYYFGKNCEQTHICKQEKRPCLNGAVCLVDGDLNENKYICKCPFGFTGVNCAYPTCDKLPCKHESSCEMVNSTNYECNCTNTGYAGLHCDTLINDSECHMFACENNTCDPNKCDCKAINCQEYISKQLRARPKDFMYHYILWPLLGIMFALLMVLFSIFVMKMKKSRATHGTYSPSRHELQASRIEFNMDMKRPPEERLI